MDYLAMVTGALSRFAQEHGFPNRISSAELSAYYTKLTREQVNRVGRRLAFFNLYDQRSNWLATATYRRGEWLIIPAFRVFGQKAGG